MEALIASMRQRIAFMGNAGCIGEHASRDYLSWMIDTAEAEKVWPNDKRIRWLGFVAGARDFATYGPEAISTSRMKELEFPVLYEAHPRCEAVLINGLFEVIDGLRDIAERASSPTLPLVEAARRSRTAAEASFCLGYAQAFMTGHGLVNVNSERDRTRPTFHRIYAECGFVIPPSKSKEA